jgi:pyruvate dehydrogenase E2 component (dihydrolipoamide acetyltransferase)
MAQDEGLDLRVIRGSGPGGRIIKRDIEKALEERTKAVPTLATPPALTDEIINVSQKRKIIAQRLAESKYSAPHYYLRVIVKMDEILKARKSLNVRLTNKVSMNAFLIKFAAEAIKKYPIINSTWNGETITKHGSIDIGLAVAQPDGLITPVVRNCAHKGIIAIDDELKVLIQKAQNNRLEPEEYTGATFTITNLGSFGIQEFTAIINPPGSAILAVGEIQKEPVVGGNDQIFIQLNMRLTLSCDHRVIDGAIGASFLKELKDMLEEPVRTLY